MRKINVLKFMITCILMIFIFTLLITLSYAIPNHLIENNATYSLDTINKEGLYPFPFFNSNMCVLDNFTDEWMIENAIIHSDYQNPIQAAMHINDYARYWHGHQIFLRPLLILFNYHGIRYINMFIIFILLSLVFSKIKEQINIQTALAFILSLIGTFIFIVPMSMQFMSVFVIMLCYIYFILNNYNKKKFTYFYISICFFVIGMITNFFDLLTAPLLTLGVPLLIILALNLKKKTKVDDLKLRQSILFIITNSFFWTIGYGISWVSKWIIGSLVLRRNIVNEAIDAILFRTTGNSKKMYLPLDRIEMLKKNISNLFFIKGKKLIAFLLLIIVLFLILFFIYRKSKLHILYSLSFIIVGVFPYLWFIVLANHSYIHFWFTYRIQIITIFAIMLFIINVIDWQKLMNKT